MYYKVDFNINNFNFWSGAYDRMKDATQEQIDQIEQRLIDYFECCDEIPTETQINDLVWFDCDDIFFPSEQE